MPALFFCIRPAPDSHQIKASEAKDPRACSNCHMGFDHPQWEMYTSARHGILEKSENWKYAPDPLQYHDAKTKIEQELYLINGVSQPHRKRHAP